MNSLFQQLNPMQNNPFVQMFKTLQCSNNPQQLLNKMVQQNPKVKQTLDLINSSGKNPRDLFYQAAKEKGVDPESILSLLR